MYERSAIILERYFNHILGLDKSINLQTIYEDYEQLIEKTKNYQEIIENEDKIISEFDEIANEIRNIQQEQKKIYKSNLKLEEERAQVFDTLGEEPADVEKKMKRIEQIISSSNDKLEELRGLFVKSLAAFSNKQNERNTFSRNRRAQEKEHLQLIEKCNGDINSIDSKLIKIVRQFINSENEGLKREIINAMIDNGKEEKVPFNEIVIEKAVEVKFQIEKRKAECYIIAFERIKKLLLEISNDDIKLEKYIRTLRDISIKFNFLKAQNNYIINFLDSERMTAINGKKVHEKLMIDECKNFDLDMQQFNNLYELILEEISEKATIESYEKLYNRQYLKNIKDKEETFQREIDSIKINSDAIINSNYWRLEEIKNIYEVFQDEVSEKFKKDLSEFTLEDTEELQYIENEKEETQEKDDIFKKGVIDEDNEYLDEYEDDEYYEDNDKYDEEDDDNYRYEELYSKDDEKYEEYEEYEEDDEYDKYDFYSKNEQEEYYDVDDYKGKEKYKDTDKDDEKQYSNKNDDSEENDEEEYYYDDDDDEYDEFEEDDDEINNIIRKHEESKEESTKEEDKNNKANKRII